MAPLAVEPHDVTCSNSGVLSGSGRASHERAADEELGGYRYLTLEDSMKDKIASFPVAGSHSCPIVITRQLWEIEGL